MKLLNSEIPERPLDIETSLSSMIGGFSSKWCYLILWENIEKRVIIEKVFSDYDLWRLPRNGGRRKANWDFSQTFYLFALLEILSFWKCCIVDFFSWQAFFRGPTLRDPNVDWSWRLMKTLKELLQKVRRTKKEKKPILFASVFPLPPLIFLPKNSLQSAPNFTVEITVFLPDWIFTSYARADSDLRTNFYSRGPQKSRPSFSPSLRRNISQVPNEHLNMRISRSPAGLREGDLTKAKEFRPFSFRRERGNFCATRLEYKSQAGGLKTSQPDIRKLSNKLLGKGVLDGLDPSHL